MSVWRSKQSSATPPVGSLERITPDSVSDGDVTGGETLKLHLERYEFAALHAVGARILDIACGVGYGTYMLASAHPNAEVTGVDLSTEAIKYANRRYRLPNIRFVVADAQQFSSGDRFSSVVSLETIEHLPDPASFIGRVAQTLVAAGGTFIGSVPVTPSVDANPHHLTDFTSRSFRKLLRENGFREFAAHEQVQPYNPLAVARRTEERMQNMRDNLLRYYAAHPGKALLRIRSFIFDGFRNKYLTVACRSAMDRKCG